MKDQLALLITGIAAAGAILVLSRYGEPYFGWTMILIAFIGMAVNNHKLRRRVKELEGEIASMRNPSTKVPPKSPELGPSGPTS